MFGFAGKKPEVRFDEIVIARLKARLQPLDRVEIYEDQLEDVLSVAGSGVVVGGGTQLTDGGEIEYCEIEISVADHSESTLAQIAASLESNGAPKGSRLLFGEDGELDFGCNEGLALYLNGVDLPDEVYQTSDINVAIEEIKNLLGEAGKYHSHWQGLRETALYFYGPSFEKMASRMKAFVTSCPLCQRSRVQQIA